MEKDKKNRDVTSACGHGWWHQGEKERGGGWEKKLQFCGKSTFAAPTLKRFFPLSLWVVRSLETRRDKKDAEKFGKTQISFTPLPHPSPPAERGLLAARVGWLFAPSHHTCAYTTVDYYTCFPSKKRRRRLALIKNTDKGLSLSNPQLLKSGGNSGFPVIGGGKMNSFCLFLSPRGCEKEKEEEGGMGFPVCRRLIRSGGKGYSTMLECFYRNSKTYLRSTIQLPNVRNKNPLRNSQICRRMLFPPMAASRMFLPCERQIVFCAPRKLFSGRQRERRRHFLPSSPPLLAQKSLDRLVFPLFFPQTFSPPEKCIGKCGAGDIFLLKKVFCPYFPGK